MTYEQAIEILCSQSKFYINLGLERILLILEILGNPQNSLKIVHVAGTNGKGSVCATISNILIKAGFKTGLYISPHLVEYTERIQIDNKQITREEFAFYIDKICKTADENNIDLTEFEILTAAAYKYFYDKKVDFAVMETGLGGRYDAVNVCKKPVATVITSISFDHTDRLGKTIDEIAYEKAGIIKDDVPVAVNENNAGLEIIKKIACEKHAPLSAVKNSSDMVFENGVNYAVCENLKYEFPLLGLYQKYNLDLIFKTLELLPVKIEKFAIEAGLKSVCWNVRFQYIKEKNLIMDGAHNPDAAFELRKSLDYYFPTQKRIFLYSTISTKDYETIARTLFRENDEIYYIPFSYKTAVTFEEYIKKVNFLKNIKPIKKSDIPFILQKAGLKILTGSFYMIGDVMKERLLD